MRLTIHQSIPIRADMNKLKVNLYFELLRSGKDKNVLRILSRDKDIKEEVHKELRRRSKGAKYERKR